MQTQSQTSALPSIAAVISHDVTDFATWQRAFDQHSTARKGAGIVAAHVNRDAANPNQLSIYLAGNDADQLNAFLASRGLMETMRDAGVKGVPAIALITPVEDRTVKDRPLAGAIVRHEVSDFASWKRAFDDDGARRQKAGILGHAVNRSIKNPNLVVIYLQAESLETLRAFAGAPELKTVMKAAGVVGAPDISFVTGGTWTN
jgi:hypothetical protein